MSDPVSNVEIEDVLSSIRRLVSTDDRAAQSDAKDQPKQAAEPVSDDESDAVDALVLTPALRVSDTAPAKAEDEEVDWSDSQSDSPSEAAQPEDDAPEPAESWPDHSDDLSDEEAVEPEDIAEADDGGPQPDEWAAETDDEAAQDSVDDWQDHTQQSSESEALSERVAGFEEAVAARDDEWEPDGDDTADDNAAAPTEPFSWQDDIEDAEIVSPEEGLEPFVEEEDDFAPEAAAPDAEPEPVPEPEPDTARDNGFLADEDLLGDDDAAVLDEEALRDLVTEIVRQELQGSLGERITRNVRKLVRREIHRALATKELE